MIWAMGRRRRNSAPNARGCAVNTASPATGGRSHAPQPCHAARLPGPSPVLAGTAGSCPDRDADPGFGPDPAAARPREEPAAHGQHRAAKGWAAGEKPTAAAGLHGRSASPTGSTIRAGSTCCPTATCWSPRPTRRPSRGRQGHQGLGHEAGPEEGRRRPCRAPTASRCCATPTATACAETRTVFLAGPELAVRHGAGRRRPLRRQHRRRRALPLQRGRDADHRAPATKVADLPGGPINHHWTKNLIASPDGSQALRRRRLQQQRRRERHRGRRPAARRSGRSTARPAQQRVFASGLRNPERHGLGAADRRAVGRRSTSATSSAATSCPTT